MARFTCYLLALLVFTGPVISQDGDNPTTTTPEPTSPTTTPTTSPTTTTPTTSPTTTPTTSPTTTPTTSPTTPDTTAEPDTTTAEPDTTTAEPDTTTPPATTTPPPATTTPSPPDTNINYNITEGNLTCLMITGEISFSVKYNTTDNTTETATVNIPSGGSTEHSTCAGENGTEWITIKWGKEGEESKARMIFEMDKKSWSFSNFSASLYLDPEIFKKGTASDKTLDLVMDYNFDPVSMGVNQSLICRASLSDSGVTASINDTTYDLEVTSTMKSIQIQAFNEVDGDNFAQAVHCTADNTSDVVPIAVGCALAGLVVIVLIAYLVGRRRRSGAYQSV